MVDEKSARIGSVFPCGVSHSAGNTREAMIVPVDVSEPTELFFEATLFTGRTNLPFRTSRFPIGGCDATPDMQKIICVLVPLSRLQIAKRRERAR